MGVYLCNEGLYPEVADILSTDGRDVHYRPYADCGVCITAKVNCTIDKIGFLGGYISGSLWIAQGTTNTSYDANTKVEYSITSYTGEFTLPTPYEMQANTDYVIIVNGSGPRYNYETPFPKDCENIIYKHAVFAGSSATDRKFFITTITTTQTGTYLEEKPLQNAYIGEVWTPGENTIAYYPFKNDTIDVTRNTTCPLTGTKQTIGYSFTSSGNIPISNTSTVSFISVWFNATSFGGTAQIPNTAIGKMTYSFTHNDSTYVKKFAYYNGTSRPYSDTINIDANTWTHFAYGYDGTKAVAYVNGQKVWESTGGHGDETNALFLQSCTAIMSDFIMESSVRTAQEVSNYYNNTKSLYGIS